VYALGVYVDGEAAKKELSPKLHSAASAQEDAICDGACVPVTWLSHKLLQTISSCSTVGNPKLASSSSSSSS